MNPTTATTHPVATEAYHYADGRLRCHSADLHELAQRVQTPCYIYDAQGIESRYTSMRSAFAPLNVHIHYAVKANANIAILRLLAELGSGMDVVSMGEMDRAFLAGTPMNRICFAGVAKSEQALRAALAGEHSPLMHAPDLVNSSTLITRGPAELINAESRSELESLARIASQLGTTADVTIRLNPGVSAGHSDKVRVGADDSKFGLPPQDILELAKWCETQPSLNLRGLHMHIGSQIHDLTRYHEALTILTNLTDQLIEAGSHLDVLDIGAGVAVSYMGEPAPNDHDFAQACIEHLAPYADCGFTIILEPGREIVAQAGVLLTTVQHIKHAGPRTIVTTDAGLNALVRPAMYSADHFVYPTVCDTAHTPDPIAPPTQQSVLNLPSIDVVGPVCESSDIFVRQRPIPLPKPGDTLAVFTAGAYAASMAMTFNDLPLPAEVLIHKDRTELIRPHQPYANLFRDSFAPPTII